MIKLPKLANFNLRGKTVLIRCDFDVPLRQAQGKLLVKDDTRIRACLPTIEYLLKNGTKVILLGHLGRPEGKVVDELKMTPVVEKLKELLNYELRITNSKVGLRIQNLPVYILDENLWLLENLRFYPGEESNDSEFTKNLSLLGGFYVNEAFAASHREHASIVGVPKLLPHCAGFNFIKEVENLSIVLENPKKPVVFVIGGAKVETKLPVIDNLFEKVDIFLLGGVVANTFMAAYSGHPRVIGKSIYDKKLLEKAENILEKQKGEKIEFPGIGKVWKIKIPTDLVIAKKEKRSFSGREIVDIKDKSGEVFDQEKMIVDIGPEMESLYGKVIEQAGTVVLAGPMGLIEEEKFSHGTKSILEAMANSKAFKVVGGGDTINALNKFKLSSKMDFISLGGGAMLEFLARGTLPGVEALRQR